MSKLPRVILEEEKTTKKTSKLKKHSVIKAFFGGGSDPSQWLAMTRNTWDVLMNMNLLLNIKKEGCMAKKKKKGTANQNKLCLLQIKCHS